MGRYLNPGNSGFTLIRNSGYVDKSGLIAIINKTVNTTDMLTCISRPRRFGKSFAAKMLSAYYDGSCDSSSLFDDLEIAGSPDYQTHLNRYHVIDLDISGFVSAARRQEESLRQVPNQIVDAVRKELLAEFPDLPDADLSECLVQCVRFTGRKFIFIIDEWDALIREAKNDPETQTAWLNLLREWFKNSNFTPNVVSAAYITGILPIKKDGSQSAVSDFREHSILYPGPFAPYTGFTEREVKTLCLQNTMPFDEVKTWYNGYEFSEVGALYNPYSVMCAMKDHKCRSYWRQTSAAESLMTYINMDFDGLQALISRLLAGERIDVDTSSFENDFETFRSRDDVLTLLVHLGYLSYQEESATAVIPNEEVRLEFRNILKSGSVNSHWIELLSRSRKLLEDTLACRGDAVAAAIDEIRMTSYAPTFYNNEQALRYVIKFAYIAALETYLRVEELPSGRGIADVVYLPKRVTDGPSLLVELKWNKSAGGAIAQIRRKDYPAVLRDFGGQILLVGINYDEKTKRHVCRIEEL